MTISITRKTRLVRLVLWLLLLLSAVAVVALLAESFRFSRSLPNQGWNSEVLRLIGLVLVNVMFTVIFAALLFLYLWVRLARSLPDLRGWHIQSPQSEFRGSDAHDDYGLDDYLRQEEQVFEELDHLINGAWKSETTAAWSRYRKDSICNPDTIADRNWNRSLVVESPQPVGGVLLLHGLSDSPYSLRAFGQRMVAEGFTVVWLRLPGHGTNPRALADASWLDWTSAVKIAVRGLRDKLPSDAPLVLAGYSNGGALSVEYALAAIEDASMPRVDSVVLFSPMIGINPMARLTRIYHSVALVSRNQKAQWSGINAEVDPFKYSSWPMNANVQAWEVTQAVVRRLAAIRKSGRMGELPPILAMQSVVDSTVVVPKLISALFDQLESKSSELFLFDVNRENRLSNLLNLSFEKTVIPLLKQTGRHYRLSALTNVDQHSQQVVLKSRSQGQLTEQKTDLSWPDGMVSMSHVAVPIPPDDPIYGSADHTKERLPLGTLSMRAEPSALLISESMFVRCRHNPFYRLMEDRVMDWLAKNCPTAHSEGESPTHHSS